MAELDNSEIEEHARPGRRWTRPPVHHLGHTLDSFVPLWNPFSSGPAPWRNPVGISSWIGPHSDQKNFVALKESSGDPRRVTDLRNTVGERYAIFVGVDDLVLEASVLGIDGWVAGVGLAFPRENQYFWELTRRGEWDKAREIYRWFTPLLHLDTHPKFVQHIKLAVQECGLGVEWVRPPRLPLAGAERKQILKIIRDGIAQRPKVATRS